MKLAKSQRHTAYIICLAEFEEYEAAPLSKREELWQSEDGFCYFFLHMMDLINKEGGYDGNIYIYFPEILKRRPKKSGWLWFPANKYGGTKHRIGILKQCIEETY